MNKNILMIFSFFYLWKRNTLCRQPAQSTFANSQTILIFDSDASLLCHLSGQIKYPILLKILLKKLELGRDRKLDGKFYQVNY